MNDSAVFAQRLKETRQNKNMTQKDLAEKVNITSSTISAYESTDTNKRKSPTLENAIAIAKALNVSLDWLSGLSNDKGSSTDKSGIPLPVILQEIVDIGNLNTTFSIEAQQGGGDYDYCYAEIRIYNEEVIDFISSWKKILELYKDNSITKEMCNDWIRGSLKKYSDMTVSPDGTIMVEIPDDDLPF